MSGNFFESVLGSSGLVIGGAGGAIGGAIAGGAVGAGGGTLALPGGGTIAGGGYGAWVGGAAGGTAGAAAGYGAGSAGGAWIDQTRPGQYVNRKVDDFRDWLYANEKAEEVGGGGTVACAGECPPAKDEKKDKERPYEGETPRDKEDDFRKVPGRRGQVKKSDGSYWEKDFSKHGGSEWKRWPSIKDFEKGRGRVSVRPDGSIR